MTFSVSVREDYIDEEGADQRRFGVAVTTRLPCVGTLCPFVNEHGAVATQSRVNVELGRKGVELLADGLAVDDALSALLNADEGRDERQLHGVDAGETFAFSGEECLPWFGHLERETYTVAGNLLTGESVIEATADAYAETRREDRPLAERLIDSLAAGHAEGGDKREDLPVQSAAVVVSNTEAGERSRPFYDDLRVDATETPIADLRETYDLAARGWEDAMDRYGDDAGDDDGVGDDEPGDGE